MSERGVRTSHQMRRMSAPETAHFKFSRLSLKSFYSIFLKGKMYQLCLNMTLTSGSGSTVFTLYVSPDFMRNIHDIQKKNTIKSPSSLLALQIESQKRNPDVRQCLGMTVRARVCPSVCARVCVCVCVWCEKTGMRLYQHRRCFNESLQRLWKRC